MPVVRVSHREAGSGGVPVVLVHGLGMSGRSVLPTLRRLAHHGRVLAPDLPGYGDTRGGRSVITPAELAGALQQWLDRQGLGAVVLVGHSLGAQVAAQVTAAAPDRVHRLVLVAPTPDPGVPTVLRSVARLVADAPRERPGLLAVGALDYARAGPLRVLRVQAASLRDPLAATAREVPVPTLVVCGGADPVSRRPWCEALTAALPDGRLAVVPGGPHGLPFSRPDELAALVRGFGAG